MPGLAARKLRVVTWNGRTILAKDGKERAKAVGVVRRLLDSADVACLQEVRGSQASLLKAFHKEKRQFLVFSSFLDEGRGGGVVIFLRRACGFELEHVRLRPLAVGRVLQILAQKAPEAPLFVVRNVHNFG